MLYHILHNDSSQVSKNLKHSQKNPTNQSSQARRPCPMSQTRNVRSKTAPRHFPTFIIFWYCSGVTPGGMPIPPIPPMPPSPPIAPKPNGSAAPPAAAAVPSPPSPPASSPSPSALTANAFSACVNTQQYVNMLVTVHVVNTGIHGVHVVYILLSTEQQTLFCLVD